MAVLTAKKRMHWSDPTSWIDWLLTAENQLYAGQLCLMGTVVKQARTMIAGATSGFLGIVLNDAAAGQQVNVRVRGVLYLETTGMNLAVGDEGTVCEVENTANDTDPETAISKTGDCPCGSIVRVDATGAGTSKGAVLIGADGFR